MKGNIKSSVKTNLNININLVEKLTRPKLKILFLGYSKNQTKIINQLIQAGCEVWHTSNKINTTASYDLVISFGYKHILKRDIIESTVSPIINLHISYLPWNRGAHPNFWSFYDCTPSGVSIHLIDGGVDTGPIIYQKFVNFSKKEITFSQTYKRLILEIEKLFKENIEEIMSKKFIALPQRCRGSYHRTEDLPKEFNGWDSNIQNEIVRLDKIYKKTVQLRQMVILGAGGHAVSVANIALSARYKIAYFVDKNKKENYLLGIKIIADISKLTDPFQFDYCIAIGDNGIRERVYNDLIKRFKGIKFPALIHQSAVISSYSTVDDGSVIMPNAIIGPNSKVGKFCIINTQASIDHDCTMLDFSSLAPKAVTGGSVIIGHRSSISIGATVKDGLKIGDDSILGAKSYLNKNLPNNKVAYGVPAKVIRNKVIR